MQIVIDIPKEAYEIIKKDTESEMYIIQVIKQGIPLDDIETLKHRSFLEGFYKAYQTCYKMFDDIKAEIDELDFDFGDFYEYDHTEEIHEMIDKVWNKHTKKRNDKE